MEDFKDKIVLVTGSGRGIGRAIALHFARLGADVAVNFFRNRQPAENVAAEIALLGRRAIVVKANVGDLDDLQSLFAEVDEKLGGLDILVSNAASGYNRPALQQKAKSWDWTLNINARALLFAAQRAAPLMAKRGGGEIVAITSPGSRFVFPDYAVVGASKAALEALVRYLAVELAPLNIAVNAVSPGVVLTDALQHFAFVRQEEDFITRAAAQVPAGRLPTPGDIAHVTAFLCSPQAAMIRGQVLVVDGGQSLRAAWREK
ncbi:MAG: enoyl-[acyl-carrier-protein] reductase FabL [Chloroflexi bacterium]|nr:enoyl-[acyl-carrier-protein] reductase FabL [Chloroflexota bacterium]